MEYLGKEQFGVFVINNTIPKVPEYPWYTDSYSGSLSARGVGDIRAYMTGEDFYIGNPAIDETRKVT
ncbi:hypothetical protein NSA52_12640 [Clostridium sporogenes]|uniref:hypothetical protein n=1 Tax=Clostridium sporogenes TaxID=1509 RepID=UPI00214A8A20|nr:hypothetical protein [Clostridium sporogenes]MCR1974972.1 hypothetical protein [Clostridium sporogenes]